MGDEVCGQKQNTTADVEMEDNDTPVSNAADHKSDTAMESVENSQGNAGRANG